jgi:hypothetical protein
VSSAVPSTIGRRRPARGRSWMRLGVVLAFGLAAATAARAGDARPSPQGVQPSPQGARPRVPPGLPRYDLDVRLDPDARRVVARERVTFTNRSGAWTRELVFHVYPRYRVPESDRLILSKTLEMLRLSPEEAMDLQGRRLVVSSVRVAGRTAAFEFDPQADTVMIVPLPEPVAPGATVAAEVDFTLDLPDKWGRWGQHAGITYLVNWYPVLAHHDDRGWERTPFVPWHQPWHQEAGHYTVRVDLPGREVIASTGRITRREDLPGDRQLVTIRAEPARDFALVCSERFLTRERQAGDTVVRVAYFPEHEANALHALDTACEVIPLYERWFGPYPEEEFEVAPSFFGWNGNECAGMVLLDDRVLRLPSAGARYIDHLITHETCHQWWYNCVGTDGYAETFMDEGLVNSFTAMRLDAQYGRNAPLIQWSPRLSWLPTIGREDLRLAGYYGWRARGHSGPVIQDLKAMGNLNTLFSLAYDRGGKVVEMIRNRLGEERFFAFFRQLYAKYSWETIHYDDLRRELVAFDPATDWAAFLDGWLLAHNETDWSVEHVRVDPPADADPAARPVSIELRQGGQMVEPTVVLCRCGDDEIRVPIWPERGDYEVPGAAVTKQAPDRWLVRVQAPARPSQVEVDPDHALLDARPDNNRWKPEVAWRFTPLMSPLDESSQFQAYDRPSIVFGPFIDQYARGGFRATAQRIDRWQITGWAGTEPDLREAIFGGQATLFHFPWPSFSAGVFYEEGLYNFYNDKRHSGGRAFLRYRFLETSSFLVDDPGFFEIYYGVGNEFWPGDDGRPVNAYLGAIGARYRLNTQFPYWDPVSGRLIDVTAEYGNTLMGSAFDYVRTTAQYGLVRPWPEGWGYLSGTRLAFSAYGGYGSPNNQPLFRLGGGHRLRALNLVQFEGNAVWLTTFEWRFPIRKDLNQDYLDHVVSVRNLYGVLFYDVGETFFLGRANPVVHGIGAGLRLDTALFSFLERANLRVDIAQPVGIGRHGPQVWFGLNQVF